MKFEWDRVYKSEEYFDQLITESAIEYITDFYGVETIEDLNAEHLKALEEWVAENENCYIASIGVNNVISMLDSHLWAKDLW